jgi:F-type H+-transporting ATPase subunit c
MRKLQYVLMTLSVLCLASPAFAQGAENLPGGGTIGGGLVALAAGLGMGLAALGCGMGQGRAAAAATEALARNPGSRAGILLLLVMGLAFIESLTLFTLLIVFVKVK